LTHPILLLVSSFLCIAPASASPWNIPAPDLPARAFLLIEAQTGAELAAHNADLHQPPASLTKLMTAYVLFGELRRGALRPDQPVTVSAAAARLPGARMFLHPGETVPVEALLLGMLVQSGNDATRALVEQVSGSQENFVRRMNAEAERLALGNTHFVNAGGLHHPDHYSSARDLTLLAAALRRDYPEYRGWFARQQFTWAGITQPNRNRLLRDPGVDGFKTGHTEAAGFSLVASGARDGTQLIATVLGTDSEDARARTGRALLDHGFRRYETRVVIRAGTPLHDLKVWEGETNRVELGAARDVMLTLPRGGFEQLRTDSHLAADALAPIARGAALGQLTLRHTDRVIAQLPLVALSDVPPGNLGKRLADRWRRGWHDAGTVQSAP
jgi:D-alanyl-D-alanine carboxypeptidase (penicillin-binding protein 5/6)